jgi:hypothetical protein
VVISDHKRKLKTTMKISNHFVGLAEKSAISVDQNLSMEGG